MRVSSKERRDIMMNDWKYPQLQWWNRHEPTPTVCVIPPRFSNPGPVQELWEASLNEETLPTAILEPLVSNRGSLGPQDVALACGAPFLVGFDAWWASKEQASKGFLPVPSAQWFYQLVMTRVPAKCRNFYQTLLPNRTCAFYFDADSDDPRFDMVHFLHALFEEMAAELTEVRAIETTPAHLWQTMVLLDASCNVLGEATKGSSHGVSLDLVFNDNHTDMKQFAQAVKRRLERRPDPKNTLRTWDKKRATWILPLDLSVYSRYRHFRFLHNAKLTPEDEKRRFLCLAAYNQCPEAERVEDNHEALFLLCVIAQPKPNEMRTPQLAPSLSKEAVPQRKRPREGTTCLLEAHLLERLAQWGNTCASVSRKEPARTTWPPGTLYVSFANATHAHDHQHRSNNVHAIVSFHELAIYWFCHKGSGKGCRKHKEALPLQIAMSGQ